VKRYLIYIVLVLLIVGGEAGWKIWSMHQQNVEAGDQMIRTANQWNRGSGGSPAR
jgi:predicted negative regulator of RcsB-dependent stress response